MTPSPTASGAGAPGGDRRSALLPIAGALVAGLVASVLQATVRWHGDPTDVVILSVANGGLAVLASWSFHLRWRARHAPEDRAVRNVFLPIAAGALGPVAVFAVAGDPELAWPSARGVWIVGQLTAVVVMVAAFPPVGHARRRLPPAPLRVAILTVGAVAAWTAIGPWTRWFTRQGLDAVQLGLGALFLVATLLMLAGRRDRPTRSESLLAAAGLLIAISHAELAFSAAWVDSPAMWGRALMAVALTVPLVGAVRDHFALLTSETALLRRHEQTQQRIEGLLDALPVMVLSVDGALQLRFANRAAEILVDPEPGDSTASPEWLGRLDHADRQAVRMAIETLLDGGSTGWERHVRAYDRGDTLHWLRLQARPITDPVDDAPLVELVATDVTDLLIARRTSESRQSRLAFLANVAQTLAGETAEARIVDRMLDMGREMFPAVGVSLYRPTADEHRLRLATSAGVPVEQPDRRPPDRAAAGPEHGAWQAFHEGFPRQMAITDSGLGPHDRERLDAAGCGHLLHLPLLAAGRPVGVASVALSEPIDLGTDVIDLLTQLGFLVGGAVYLSQLIRELDEQRAVAMEASRLKSEFLANTSHELRTPLTAIIGFLRLILDGSVEDPAKQADFLRIAHESADKLLTIINDVLDLAKIEAGRLEVHQAPVPIRSVLADVRRLFAHQMKGRGLGFEVDPPDEALVAWADPDRVLQILTNLLSNAIKFTPKGGWVAVDCTSVDREIRLTVRDSGVGLAEGELDKVFASFYQVDGSSTRPQGGTGLGLTISRRLAELMGGALRLESSGPGTGTTATLSLTAYREPRS